MERQKQIHHCRIPDRQTVQKQRRVCASCHNQALVETQAKMALPNNRLLRFLLGCRIDGTRSKKRKRLNRNEYDDKHKYDVCVIEHDVVFNDCEAQEDTTTKIPMYVDMVKYGNVFGTGSDENLGHAHEYERMDLTPQEIKNFIDKGIDMKSFKEQ